MPFFPYALFHLFVLIRMEVTTNAKSLNGWIANRTRIFLSFFLARFRMRKIKCLLALLFIITKKVCFIHAQRGWEVEKKSFSELKSLLSEEKQNCLRSKNLADSKNSTRIQNNAIHCCSSATRFWCRCSNLLSLFFLNEKAQ